MLVTMHWDYLQFLGFAMIVEKHLHFRLHLSKMLIFEITNHIHLYMCLKHNYTLFVICKEITYNLSFLQDSLTTGSGIDNIKTFSKFQEKLFNY